MAQDKKAIDVGHEVADILIGWRPSEGYAEDIASAVMCALERYNIEVAPDLESELRTIFVYLDRQMDERRMSF